MVAIKNSKNVDIFKERIRLILFAIFVINKTFVYSVLNYDETFLSIRKIILYTIYILFIIYNIYELLKKNKVNVLWLSLLILSLIISLVSKNTEPLIALLIILTFKDIKFEKIVKTCCYSNIFSWATIIMLSLINVIPNYRYFTDTAIRYSLGFYYPTFPSTILFFIILMRLFIKKKKISIIEICISLFVVIMVYKYTLSKTGLILSVIVITFEIMCKILKLLKINVNNIMESKIVKNIVVCIPIIILLFSIITAIFYNTNSQLMISLNKLLNNRLYVSNKTINDEGISLLGKNITWIGNGGRWHVEMPEGEYNFVDNAYLKMMLDAGVIYLIIFMIIIEKNQKILINKKEYTFLFIISIILVWGISEPNILDLEKNVFLIMVFSNVIDKQKLKLNGKRENEEECN